MCATPDILAVVDEDGLPATHAVDGNPLRSGEVAGSNSAVAIGAAGTLSALVDFGADGPHPTEAFSIKTVNVPVRLLGLTSHSDDIWVVSTGGILTGYVEKDATTGYGAGDRPVFTLTVGSDGSYKFTLLDHVDHPSQDNTANDNSENMLPVGSTFGLRRCQRFRQRPD